MSNPAIGSALNSPPSETTHFEPSGSWAKFVRTVRPPGANTLGETFESARTPREGEGDSRALSLPETTKTAVAMHPKKMEDQIRVPAPTPWVRYWRRSSANASAVGYLQLASFSRHRRR